MSIEEKAKAYDEALERAKKFAIDDAYASQGVVAKLIFPELRESEDERIRKAIQLILIATEDEQKDFYSTHGLTRKDCTDWLEKQKEQKQTDLPAGFYVTLPDGKKYYTKEMRCNGMNVKVVVPKPAEWSEEDEKMLNQILGDLEWARLKAIHIEDKNRIPYDKKSAWLKSLRPQTKQEWSEEDEKIRNLAIEWAETMDGQFRFVDMGSTDFRKIVAWLKDLRPSWKPSEEQMDALAYAIQILDDGLSPKAAKAGEELEHLREQLKKL